MNTLATLDVPVMQSPGRMEADPLDVIEEMRLRTWARKNYAPLPQRDENWHPIVLDEMACKDRESL